MADEPTGSVVINEAALAAFGTRLYQQFTRYERDRFPLEQQWSRNLRQYRGIYDPEVKIRPNGSNAYPKFTRKWVNGTVSRLMQMLFPQTEFNWDIEPTPIPDISTNDLQLLLNEMSDQAAEQGLDEIPDEAIEEQIKTIATQKCGRMREKMQDQLEEMDYPALAKKVVFSGVLYGTGLLSGPLIKSEKHRSWRKDATTGRYIATESDRLAPWYEFESIWDWYPDLSAKTRKSQDGHYFRRVMSREQVRKLANRPDFMGARVKAWLTANTTGNYRERAWETEVRVDGDRKYATELNTRKYEVLEWWGYVSGHELVAAGVAIPESELQNEFESNVWSIGDTVIKCIVNPMEKKRRPLNEFVFEEDDISLAGIGLPQVCRDSQLAICESTRMALDNGSIICTPSKLIKLGLLLPGHDLNSSPYKDWYQDPDAPDNTQDAVKNLSFDSHINELQALIMLFKGFGEEEVSLPPISSGDVSQGGSEGARTQGNLSMLMGAASLPIRDTVRNFDLFTDGVMTGLYDWNMEFDSDQKAKGDYAVITTGSTSLIAKEVRAGHYATFTQTIQPEERDEIDWRKFVENRMKTIDMVPAEVLADPETVKANKQARAEREQAMMQAQMGLTQSEMRVNVAKSIKDIALAGKAKTAGDIDTYRAILEGLDQVAQQEMQADDQERQHMKDAREHVKNLIDLSIKKKQADKPAAKAA
jgi:hypothetical protein